MKIGIIGYGELGVQFHHLIKMQSSDNDFIIFDDSECNNSIKNLESFNNYLNPRFKEAHFVIALGYKHLKTKCDIIDKLIIEHCEIFSFIHETSFVQECANVDKGVFIYPMCNIDKDVIIESGVIINNSCVVSHNSKIGSSSYLSPGVVVCGNVNIGKRVFIGAGSVISNNIKIGDDVIIGVGTIVSRDIPSGASAIGNPLRILPQKIKLV